MKTPRVLVSSIDVWNSTSGSDTFTNLFSGYNPDCVANIYLRSGIPSSPAANNYFYICENNVIKSFFKPFLKTGWSVKKEETSGKDEMRENLRIEERRYSFFSKHRLWLFLYAREMLWKIGKWKSTELDMFVENFQPEVLFFPIESYIHFNRLNIYLINKTRVPAIAYMWDDNFTYKQGRGLGFFIHRFFLRRNVKKLLKLSGKVFVISPKMKKELKEFSGIDAQLLTKGAQKHIGDIQNNYRYPLKIVYTGKLVYGRIETLIKVAEAIEKVNKEFKKYELHIYSGTQLDSSSLKTLNRCGASFFGYISQEKVSEIQNDADILLMLEAISGKHKYDARLSFSTKMVDYLAAGKCLIAIGPEDIASIEYLKSEDAALVASNDKDLDALFTNLGVDSVKKYAKKALELAETKHNILDVQNSLYAAFDGIKE